MCGAGDSGWQEGQPTNGMAPRLEELGAPDPGKASEARHPRVSYVYPKTQTLHRLWRRGKATVIAISTTDIVSCRTRAMQRTSHAAFHLTHNNHGIWELSSSLLRGPTRLCSVVEPGVGPRQNNCPLPGPTLQTMPSSWTAQNLAHALQ